MISLLHTGAKICSPTSPYPPCDNKIFKHYPTIESFQVSVRHLQLFNNILYYLEMSLNTLNHCPVECTHLTDMQEPKFKYNTKLKVCKIKRDHTHKVTWLGMWFSYEKDVPIYNIIIVFQ